MTCTGETLDEQVDRLTPPAPDGAVIHPMGRPFKDSGGLRLLRGNLALALKLDGVFDRRDRPSDRTHPGRVLAAGVDTFYLEAGSGPPIILLHGLAMTNASMMSTLAALAKDHRVIAPDLPGFGDTGKPEAAYDPAFFSRWLIAFMDAMKIDRAAIAGNSMGGRIAIETALVAPHRVDKLVLFAPSLAFRNVVPKQIDDATRRARQRGILHVHKSSEIERVQPVGVLLGVDQLDGTVGIEMTGQRQLHDESGASPVVVEDLNLLLEELLSDVGRMV